MNNYLSLQEIDLNELPSYTNWIELLLLLKDNPRKFPKTPEEVLREYDIEKWGKLYEELNRLDAPNINDAERIFSTANRSNSAFTYQNKLYKSNQDQSSELYHKMIQEYLKSFQHSNHSRPSLIELGAGYGSISLRMPRNSDYFDDILYCGEFTQSGLNCLDLLAKNHYNKVLPFYFDFYHPDFSIINIPNNSIVFTNMALAYIQGFPYELMKNICNIKPSFVIHFEPIYEHWDKNILIHLLWMKYARLNNYNCSILRDLRQFSSDGAIEILEENKSFIGTNPLFPVSFIVWRPL